MRNMNIDHLARKCAVLAIVVIIGFLSGWSATGPTGAFVTAIALGAGCAVAVFRDDRTSCLSRLARHRSRTRSSAPER